MKGVRRNNAETNRLTREAISTALVLLMEEKEFPAITVTDIVKKAGVSRTAYYNNYYYKEDVLKDLLNRFMDEILETAGAIVDNQVQPEALFRLVGSNREIYMLFLKGNMGDFILGEMTRKLCENVAEDNTAERMRLAFWAGGLYALIREWFTGAGRTLATEEMIALYYDLVTDLFSTRTGKKQTE